MERIRYIEDVKDSDFFKKFDTIINFGIQPYFSKRMLNINELIDFQLANILK
ncbi:hypothetical protein J5751_02940 [bacterium]|nr:hypothetical protein [bacterium]